MSKNKIGLGKPAYMHILHMIKTKQLMPGDRVPESRIAEEFQISRTPVRDAMRQLSREGLIELFPHRFAQVRVYSADAICEIGTLRVALDTMSVKLAGLYGSRADFLQLMELAQQCSHAAAQGDREMCRYYDGEFHLNRNPKEFTSVSEYIKSQGRFKHLTDEDILHIEAQRDAKWKKIRSNFVTT